MPKTFKIVTPIAKLSHPFGCKQCIFVAKCIIHRKRLMNELTRFIAETPLWLTIIFLAVFAAMSIWCLVLLVQALRGKW